MNLKTATYLIIAANLWKESLAIRGGDHGMGGDFEANGHQGGQRRPFSGGPHGNKPGFPGDIELELTEITCDADLRCALPYDNDGTYVCRERYQPITGEINAIALCIPNEKAWVTDECGCCGDTCNEQPDFIEINCDGDDQDSGIAVSRSGGHGHNPFRDDVEVAIICRSLFNPFTGEKFDATIPVPSTQGLDGDTCGCCDGVCPERGQERFPRPEPVDIECLANNEISCELPRKGRGEQDALVDGTEGLFVCREVFNPITGVSDQQALCIPSGKAWATDECGCCGIECPDKPMSVELECDEGTEPVSCEMRNGAEGVFVCRSLFHPISGQIEERSLCIPSDKAWITDACGCCGAGCPATPADGFEDEDTQLLAAALEAPEDFAFNENNKDSGSGSLNVNHGYFLLLVVSFSFIF